jgi:CIC family chloride channel protein
MQRVRGLPLEATRIFVQAAIIGLFGGLLGVAFRWAVVWLGELVMGPGAPVEVLLPWWQSLLIPTLGALGAGLLLRAIRDQRGPFGIGDVVEMAMTRRSTIRVVPSIVQICSSGLSIASGGSIGREGANSQFGATLAAWLGRNLPNTRRSRTVLIGCGIAAGMASAYKAPIAAAIFVMEVVLGNFAMDVLAPIVVASVISTLVTVAVFGQDPLYHIGQFELTEWPLVLSAGLLGAMCGLGGIAFRRCLEFGRRVFDRIPAPLAVRMTLGGLLVGLIGIWHPEVWGNGQTTIFEIVQNPGTAPTFLLLASLLVFKTVATAITAGSGALGGVFTPNLVVGAVFGAAFARGVDLFVVGEHHTEFALVGMAGLCAATTHAPITAIMLIFEMTGNYGLILPLMLCSILASITARMLDEDSIYTARLRARGHRVGQGLEELAIHQNYVRDIMRRDAARVLDTAPFDDILELFQRDRADTVHVVNTDGRLLGMIHLHDVKQFINDPTLGSVVIAADLTRPAPSVAPDESLAAIIERFDDPDLAELPVVRSATDQHLEGRVTRRDLVTCLSEEVLGERKLRAKLKIAGQRDTKWIEMPPGAALTRLPVPDDLVDRSLDSLDLVQSHGVHVLVVVRRDELGREERVLPRPELVLEDGFELVVFGAVEDVATFRRLHGLDGSA